LYKIFLIVLLTLFLQAQDKYELGNGVQVGSLPFYLGGYISLDYRNMGNENRYRADDIALLGYGSYGKFSYLAEFEFAGFYVRTNKAGENTVQKDTRIHPERLYVDYNLNENYIFSLGRINSDIGFWNLLPINVLRQTSSSPIAPSILFPKYTTGITASYTNFSNAEIKTNVIIQNNNDLDDDINNYKVGKHYGAGITYAKDDYTIKFNSGYFHIENNILPENGLYYFLFSYKYDTEKYQFLGEIGSQESNNGSTIPYAGYIQGLYRFTQKHIGVLRVESYDDRQLQKSDDIGILGYTYRPSYPVAIKSEYQFHSLHQENLFLFSISVLF
jgi:hypothetical protein